MLFALAGWCACDRILRALQWPAPVCTEGRVCCMLECNSGQDPIAISPTRWVTRAWSPWLRVQQPLSLDACGCSPHRAPAGQELSQCQMQA